MNNQADINLTLGAFVWMTLGAINPEAAAGAVCGGLFFWSLSPEIPVYKRFWLAVASIGLGYGMALPSVRSDSGYAWVIAGFGASLVHVVIVAVLAMVKQNSPIPHWMRELIDALPWTKTREEEKP